MERADPFSLEFLRTHARDAAEVLSSFDGPEVAAFLETLPAADAAILLRRLVPHLAAECLDNMSVLMASMALEELPADLGALLLRRVDAGHRTALLAAVSGGLAEAIRSALRYADTVVGALMDARVPAFHQDQTVAAALEMLRRGAASAGTVFVIDDQFRLTGAVEAARLLSLPPATPLRQVQDREVQSFSARMDAGELLQHPAWHTCDIAPVVDHNGLFLGGLRRSALALALAAGTPADGRGQSLTELLFECADVFWTAGADLFTPSSLAPRERRK